MQRGAEVALVVSDGGPVDEVVELVDLAHLARDGPDPEEDLVAGDLALGAALVGIRVSG